MPFDQGKGKTFYQKIGFDSQQRPWVFKGMNSVKVIDPEAFKIVKSFHFGQDGWNWLVTKQLKDSPFMVIMQGMAVFFTDSSEERAEDILAPETVSVAKVDQNYSYTSSNLVCGYDKTLYIAEKNN